jgi:diadenylate cyclase
MRYSAPVGEIDPGRISRDEPVIVGILLRPGNARNGSMLESLREHWRDLLDILILASLFYYLFRFIRGTRAAQMFVGLLIILLLSLLAGALQLNGLNWLISSLKTVWVLAFLILFQPELRKALTSLGGQRIFGSLAQGQEVTLLGEVIQAVEGLSEKRIGALIVLERSVGLKNIVETGTALDARLSSELLTSVFLPWGPLHDGAVVVSGDRVLAAGCILPLSQNPRLAYQLGTRHRAALGMTEETDALVIVVSEETGHISIAEGARMIPNLDPGSLRSNLSSLVSQGKDGEKGKRRKSRSKKSPDVAESAARS